MPDRAGAVPSSCHSEFQFLYASGVNFPQPVPPGSPGDDALRVQIVLGAGAISNGTKLIVDDVRFDLDCSAGAGSPAPCTDDGTVIEYGGDATISTDCTDGSGQPITWSTGHPVDTLPNEVQFTPSSPIDIQAGSATSDDFLCSLEFDIKVVGRPSSGTVVENLYDGPGSVCDNGLAPGVAAPGAFDECQVCTAGTCTTGACDSSTGECVAVSCDDGDSCTADSCDPALGCVHTPVCQGRCHAAPVCKHQHHPH